MGRLPYWVDAWLCWLTAGCVLLSPAGFPFNVVDHPQYVGSVMTLWSTYVLFGGQSPPSMLALSIYWTLLYVVTGIKEDRL